MTEWREESHKSYFLGLSLFIHIALLILLLKITNTDRILLEQIMPHERTLEQQNNSLDLYTPAALKSRASNFGAPVHFHDEPQIAGNDSDGADQQTRDGIDSQQEQEVQDQSALTIQEPTQEQQEKNTQAAEAPQEKQTTLVMEQNIGQQKPKNLQKEEALEPKPEPEKKEKPIQVQQKPAPKIVQKQRAQRSLGNDLRSAGPIKKQLTLADLAEGFINTLNRGGNDWLDRDGDDKKRPDFEDLKYLSYTKKVVWYMQNEWRATQDKLGIQLRQEYILSVIITFLKDGSIGNVRVVKPSGNPQLDEFLIRGIRNAGPYPPIPGHFKSDSFDLPLNIVNASERSQPWQMYLSKSR